MTNPKELSCLDVTKISVFLFVLNKTTLVLLGTTKPIRIYRIPKNVQKHSDNQVSHLFLQGRFKWFSFTKRIDFKTTYC